MYANGTCTGAGTPAGAVAVVGTAGTALTPATATASSVPQATPTAGAFSFVAVYSGSAAYGPSTSACELLSVTGAAATSAPNLVLVGCSNIANDSGASIGFAAAAGAITTFTATPVAGVVPATVSLATPTGAIECGVVAQDAGGGSDLNPNTVDPGGFTARVNAPATILESNSTTWNWNCGAGVTPESCASGLANAAGTSVSPVPGNVYHIGLLPGSTYGIVGTATPAISTSATWNPTIPGEIPVTSPSVTITVVEPQYTLILAANPGTIPANLPTSTNAVGSVITAYLYHVQTGNACVVLVSGSLPTYACNLAGGTLAAVTAGGGGYLLVPGAESGTVEFQTNLGIFTAGGAAPAGPYLANFSNATQYVSEHCGAIPNTFPTSFVPTSGLVTTLNLNSCQTVTVTLVGGGEAGTATIIGNFIGDFTGATASFGIQGEVLVNLTPGPITVGLSTGCNEVLTPPNLAGGSTGAQVAALATGFNVTSIWIFQNGPHTFGALYFPGTAPTDISSAGPNQSVFVCGTGVGTFRVA